MIRLTIRVYTLLGGLLHLLAGLFFLGLWVAIWHIADRTNALTGVADLALGVMAVWCLREGAALTWSAFR